MPNFHKFEWGDLIVKSRPIGIRRWFRFIPYFTGSEPIIRVTVNTKSGKERPLRTALQLNQPDQTTLGSTIHISLEGKPVSSVSKDVKFRPIAMSGDHKLMIDLHITAGGADRRELVTFTAISGDRITITIFSTVLIIIGGIIGGLVVKYLFGG